MDKSRQEFDSLQVGLAKKTRRLTSQLRARWSADEAESRRRMAMIMHRQLAFIATIGHA